MSTSVRITTAYLDVLAIPSNAEVRSNQFAIEVLHVPSEANVRVKGFDVEVLMQAPTAAVSITGTLLFIVSGVTYGHAIGNLPLLVSAEWSVSGGQSPFTYSAWQFSGVVGEAGFVSTATTSEVTRTYTFAGGQINQRAGSASVSGISTISQTFLVYVRGEKSPNPWDGRYVGESQARRRVWP